MPPPIDWHPRWREGQTWEEARPVRGGPPLWTLLSGAGLVAYGLRLRRDSARLRGFLETTRPAPAWAAAMRDRAASKLEMRPRAAVRAHSGEGTPFVCGVWKPVICLPQATLENAEAEELEMILGHELAHVRSADLVWQEGARALSALFWYHPMIWFVLRAYRRASERVCDAAALHVGGDVDGYARTLARARVGPARARR